ncbi:Ephrin-B2a [Tyrophagus putrescentiae]|nr:Ephrin-B2a [Tyrophagus putrescentiae]
MSLKVRLVLLLLSLFEYPPMFHPHSPGWLIDWINAPRLGVKGKSESVFRIDNTDHIIDVNRGNVAYEYDQVDIRCPMYSKGTREEDVESYIIYNTVERESPGTVSKEEYDTCQIANPAGSRTIAVCDKPYLHRYFTITFRPFTPQPGGLEFRPGQDYYFIALSARPNEPNPTKDCQKYHMKVVFKVCCKKPSQTIGSIIRGSISGSSTTVAPSVSSSISSSIVSSSAVPSFAIPRLENDTRVSNYPGVISGRAPSESASPVLVGARQTLSDDQQDQTVPHPLDDGHLDASSPPADAALSSEQHQQQLSQLSERPAFLRLEAKFDGPSQAAAATAVVAKVSSLLIVPPREHDEGPQVQYTEASLPSRPVHDATVQVTGTMVEASPKK